MRLQTVIGNELYDYFTERYHDREVVKYMIQQYVKKYFDNDFELFVNDVLRNEDYGSMIPEVKKMYEERIDYLEIGDLNNEVFV